MNVFELDPWELDVRLAIHVAVGSNPLDELPRDQIPEAVALQVREALGKRPSEELIPIVDTSIPFGPSNLPPFISLSGRLRLIIDAENIDRGDPVAAESFMDFAQKCAKEALGYDVLRDGPL